RAGPRGRGHRHDHAVLEGSLQGSGERPALGRRLRLGLRQAVAAGAALAGLDAVLRTLVVLAEGHAVEAPGAGTARRRTVIANGLGPFAHQRGQRLRRIGRRRAAGLIRSVDAVTVAAHAHLAGLEPDPIALAHDATRPAGLAVVDELPGHRAARWHE